MCVGDYRLGRLITSFVRNISVGAASGVFLPPDPNRVGILFGGNSSNAIWITSDGPAAANQGFLVPISDKPQMISLRDHGDLPTKGFNAIAIGGATVMQVTIFVLPESALAAHGIQ